MYAFVNFWGFVQSLKLALKLCESFQKKNMINVFYCLSVNFNININ